MRETNPCSERELAVSVAKNDPSGVRVFFAAYHASVYRYMLGLCGNRDDADDLAQDALLRAKAQIRSWRGESSLKTWVHRVAYHTFTHWHRRKPVSSQFPSTATHGEAQLAALELTRALATIGTALSHPFLLQELIGFSIEEIAAILDIPPGTVKSRLFTARNRLREILTVEDQLNVPIR